MTLGTMTFGHTRFPSYALLARRPGLPQAVSRRLANYLDGSDQPEGEPVGLSGSQRRRLSSPAFGDRLSWRDGTSPSPTAP